MTNLHSAICVIRLRYIYGRIVKESFTLLPEPFGPFVFRTSSGEKILFQGLNLPRASPKVARARIQFMNWKVCNRAVFFSWMIIYLFINTVVQNAKMLVLDRVRRKIDFGIRMDFE